MLTNKVKRSRLLRSVVRRSHGSIDKRFLTKHIAKAIRTVNKIEDYGYFRTENARLKEGQLTYAFIWRDTPQDNAFWSQLNGESE